MVKTTQLKDVLSVLSVVPQIWKAFTEITQVQGK